MAGEQCFTWAKTAQYICADRSAGPPLCIGPPAIIHGLNVLAAQQGAARYADTDRSTGSSNSAEEGGRDGTEGEGAQGLAAFPESAALSTYAGAPTSKGCVAAGTPTPVQVNVNGTRTCPVQRPPWCKCRWGLVCYRCSHQEI